MKRFSFLLSLCNIEAKLTQYRTEPLLPGVLLNRPLLPGTPNFAALVWALAVERPDFAEIIDIPVAKDLIANPEQLGEFPVEGGQITSPGSWTLEIAVLEVSDLFSVNIVAETEVNLALAVNFPAVVVEFGISPTGAKHSYLDT